MASSLIFDKVTAGYGDAIVLEAMAFAIPDGESLAILGRNGVGKTTVLETLMGNTRVSAGAVHWLGEDITRRPSYVRARAGLGWVPQEREVFPSLTVEENLTVVGTRGYWNLHRVYDLFPRLAERRRNYGNQLSGGEQQMLAIGRALMTNPRLLLLDEPMEGLAPIIVEELALSIRRMQSQAGLPSIVVEQHPSLALEMTDRVIVLERGSIIYAGTSALLASDPGKLEAMLGVSVREESAESSTSSCGSG